MSKSNSKNLLLAPNGKPSNLTPEQYKLVRTPEFKAWFGDWEKLAEVQVNDSGIDESTLEILSRNVSKVVDENGEPLVVYHGSKSIENITIFKVKEREKGYYRNGKHFKTYYDTGETEFVYFSDKKEQSQKYGTKIYECFLNLKKPYFIDANGMNYYGTSDYIEKAIETQIDTNLSDAIIIKNIQDSPSKYGDGVLNTTFMVKPNQIKLADGSNTTFDGSNPDIRFEDGGDVSDENRNYLLKKNGSYLENKTSHINTAKQLLKDLGVDAEFSAYSDTNGVSIYFEEKNTGKKIRVSDHSVRSKSRMENEILMSFDEKYMDGSVKSNFELNKKTAEEILGKNNLRKNKYADGSNTTFDGSNPDIRFADGGLIDETYNKVLKGEINSDEGAIFLDENGVEVTNELYDKLRDAEKMNINSSRGLQVGDMIMVKGKHGIKDFAANFRGFTNEGRLVVTFEGGKQISISKDEYYLNPDIMSKGGKTLKDMQFNNTIMYHEKNGNIMIGKNTIYMWLYDDKDALQKLNSGEYDYVFFPPATLGMALQKGFVPPLLRVWTKKYQKNTKGSEHLIGIIEAYYDESNNKLYIKMMTTNPKHRGKGVMSYMVKRLRQNFDLSQEDLIFVDTTKDGKKFEEAKQFDGGGETDCGCGSSKKFKDGGGVSDACVEEIVGIVNSIQKVKDFYIIEDKLIIIFEDGLMLYAIEMINVQLNSFKECHDVIDPEAHINYDEGYKSIYLKLKKNDISIGSFDDGGTINKASDFSKVITKSSRFRPYETVFFEPTLVGLNGNQLISYTWSYEWTEDWSKSKGEPVAKRISDWTQAEISAETGRNIVHQYTIKKTDGTEVTVSSDSVPILLGYIDREQSKQFTNIATAAKTLAKQKLQLSILEAKNEEFQKAKKEIIDRGYPEVVNLGETNFGTKFGMGIATVYQRNENNQTIDKERLETLQYGYVQRELEKLGFEPYSTSSYSTQIYDLKNRIARQERKIQNIIGETKMADGGRVSVKKYKSSTKSDAYDFVRNLQTYSYEVKLENGKTFYLNAKDKQEAIEMAREEEAERKQKQNKINNFFKPYKSIEQIAKEKNVSLDYANEQLKKGMQIESEHTYSLDVQKIIALQHLDESIDYYNKLEIMEQPKDIDKYYDSIKRSYSNGGEIDRIYTFETPTGAYTMLQYVQQILVRTSQFKKYFGDWETAAKNFLADNRNNFEKHYKNVSKVINLITLEPLVVYHGSNADKEFFEFDATRKNEVGRPYAYFADNIEYSQNFTTFSQRGVDEKPLLYKGFLKINNPFFALGDSFEKIKRNKDYWLLALTQRIYADKEGNVMDEKVFNDYLKATKSQLERYLEDSFSSEEFTFWKMMARDFEKTFKTFLIVNGYDGVRYSEEFIPVYDENNPQEFTRAWTIFDASQIKLADGRNINFDPMSKDIRYEDGGDVQETDVKNVQVIQEQTFDTKASSMRNKMGLNEKMDAGGFLLGKKDGKLIAHNDGDLGGIFVGKRHSEGGIDGINKATGQPIEVEGEEIQVNSKAAADTSKKMFNGKKMTNREILSFLNVEGGGKSFKMGGEIEDKLEKGASVKDAGMGNPIEYKGGEIILTRGAVSSDKKYEYNGKMMTTREIASEINVSNGGVSFAKGGDITKKDFNFESSLPNSENPNDVIDYVNDFINRVYV